jgi:hypothetical protein
MRTKALLLAAAFAAAGISTSVGQVFSVNAVGYVNVTVKPGFNLVANPLEAGATGNQIGNLARNIQGRTVPPDATRIFKFRNDLNRFVDALWDETSWIPAANATEVIPVGESFFIFSPLTTDMTLTFVGEVKQGTLANPLPLGFSLKANMVPQAGRANAFGLPAQDGDRYFQWDAAAQRYRDWVSDEGTWVGPGNQLPDLAVGEGFLLFRGTSAGTWTRNFNVNTGVSNP